MHIKSISFSESPQHDCMMTNPAPASDILGLQLPRAANLREDCSINLNLDHSQAPLATQPSRQLRPGNSSATGPITPTSILPTAPVNKPNSTTVFTSLPSTSGRTTMTTPRMDSSSAGHNCQSSVTPDTPTNQHCLLFQQSSVVNPSRPPPLQGQLGPNSSQEQSPPPTSDRVDSPPEQGPGGMNIKDTPRSKSNIGYIDDVRSRQVTFLKRKNGVMKKAMELSILCDCQVAVIVYSKDTSKMFEYSSHDMVQILSQYAEYGGSEGCPSSTTEEDSKPDSSVFESSDEARSTLQTCAIKRRHCDEGDDGRQPRKRPRQARCDVSPSPDVRSPAFGERPAARNVPVEHGITTGATGEGLRLDWELDFERQFSDAVRSDGVMSAWMTGDTDAPGLPSPIVDGENIIDDHVTISADAT